LTNTDLRVSSLEDAKAPFFNVKGVSIRVAMTALPRRAVSDTAQLDREGYAKLIYHNRADKGGHFAALEQPEIFSRELRAVFKSPR